MAVVNFDGVNKIITEISAAGDNTIEVIDVYSDWKRWAINNSQFEQAFSVVGGDPISATQNLGSTFFLENGWRIRPAELDHKLILEGNIFTREEGQSVFVSTLGTFTVNAESKVSNLVDSSVARLDLAQLLQAVYIDTSRGVAGTGDDVGIPTNPVNNFPDALTIANNQNLIRFELTGVIDFAGSTDLTGFGFVGSSPIASQVVVNNETIEGSEFILLAVTGGPFTGRASFRECWLAAAGSLTNFDGVAVDCGLNGLIQLDSAATQPIVFKDCISTVAGTGKPQLDCNGTSADIQFRRYTGGLLVTNFNAGGNMSIDMTSGSVEIASSCTSGTIVVRGDCDVTDNSGPGCNVIVRDDSSIEVIRRMTYNRVVFDANTNIATIYEEDESTVWKRFDLSGGGREEL